MQTITTKRSANVSRSVAMAELLKANPDADILSLVKRGSVYVATLRLAESEPPKEKKEAPTEEPADEAPEPSGEEESDDGGDEGGGDDFGADFGGGEGGPEGMPEMKAPSSDESLARIADLLQQLVHAGGGGMKPPMPHGGPPGMEPPMPPMGGPGAGGHPGAPPLPPPAQKHPQGAPMSGPSFASRRTFVASRDDAHEVSDQDAIREAHDNFPGYKVAQIKRDRETNVLKVAMIRE